MLLRAAGAGLLAMTLLFAACSDSHSYPDFENPDDYALDQMALPAAELPDGFNLEPQASEALNNEDWAGVIAPDDPEAKVTQLVAQKRVRSHLTYYVREDPTQALAKPITITSQSTLFETEEAAKESASTLCGILISDPEAQTVEEFKVPKLGDQSAGFFDSKTDFLGVGLAIDTVVCFRTGRVVHAIVQTGFNGSQDIGLSVRLARRMLDRVEAVFSGKALDEETPDTGDNG